MYTCILHLALKTAVYLLTAMDQKLQKNDKKGGITQHHINI